jgi:hypothetical protein
MMTAFQVIAIRPVADYIGSQWRLAITRMDGLSHQYV